MTVFRRCPGDVCRHGLGPACEAERTRHWRFCELTDPDHPDYDPRCLPIVRGEVRGVKPPAAAPSPSALWLAKSCDHRGPQCQLGCGGEVRICTAGRGPVRLSDCLRCVADPSSPGGPTLD